MKKQRQILFLFGAILVVGVLVFGSNRIFKSGKTRATTASFPSVATTPIPTSQIKGAQDVPFATPTPKPFGPTPTKVETGSCRNVPIIMYHHIGETAGPLWDLTKDFTAQMDYLGERGYTTVTLVDVIEALKDGKDLPAKPVVLTFDDGYRDFYTNAYPILKAHNFKATVFIISQLMDGDAYLTWGQAAEMASSGLVTIGDHTLSHRSIPNLSPEEVKNEIISAQNIIQERLGIKTNVFAYPYGGVSAEGEKVLKDGGFTAAVTTKRGVTSCAGLPYEMPRIRVGNAPLSSYGF